MEYLFLPVGGKRLVKPETLTVDEADEVLKVMVMPPASHRELITQTLTHSRVYEDTKVDNASCVCARRRMVVKRTECV